jgi:hypothetical protein
LRQVWRFNARRSIKREYRRAAKPAKSDNQQTSDVLRILHGARSLPPVEAAEALRPFLESMRKSGSDDALARASIAAVAELARSLKENHAASDDLWQEAIEATLSYANEAG